MTPVRHPEPETLISFASGALPPAASAIVACHLAMCPVCAKDARRLDVLGGLMLERQGAESMNGLGVQDAAVHWPMPRWDDEPERPDAPLFAPLINGQLPAEGDPRWQNLTRGLQQYRLPLPGGSAELKLLRLLPGGRLPHSAADTRLALVLKGRFTDGVGNDFGPGDVIEWTDGQGPEIRAADEDMGFCLVSNDPASGAAILPLQRLREALPVRLRPTSEWGGVRAWAAAIALLVGIGLGWLARGSGEPSDATAGLVGYSGNRLVAQGRLREALETLPSSGVRSETLDGRELGFGIRMTFQDQDGRYCRQYQVTGGAVPERYSGIACRIGEDWDVRVQAQLPPASGAGRIVPADGNGNAAMDALIGAWMSGDPIVGPAEAEIMGKGWRK